MNHRFFVFSLVTMMLLGLLAACTATTEPASDATPAITNTVALTPTVIELTSEPTEEPELVLTSEPEPTETAVSLGDLSTFLTLFQTALIDQEMATLSELMAADFGYGGYRSEWQLGTPEQFLPQIEAFLPATGSLQIVPDADLVTLLDGQDPQMMMGPDIAVAAVFLTTGWGPEGADEAILFVEELPNGRFVWKAMLYAADGFQPAAAELPIIDEQPAPVGLIFSDTTGALQRVATDGSVERLTIEQTALPSPDGQHAIYESEGDLWLIELETGQITSLTSADGDMPTFLAGYQQWVDNDTILVGVWLDLETEGGPNLGHPALIDISTGEMTLIDADRLMASFPAAAPTGAIAYSSVQRSADDTAFTWIYTPEAGTEPFDTTVYGSLPTGGYTAPAWSTNGRLLAWLILGENNQTDIAVFDTEAQTVRVMPGFAGAAFGGPYPNPIFNPSGSHIALRQFTNDIATTGLWVYPLDGAAPLFVAQNGGESLWVSDEQLLFVDYDENFNGQLQQVNIQTSIRSVITLPDALLPLSVAP